MIDRDRIWSWHRPWRSEAYEKTAGDCVHAVTDYTELKLYLYIYISNFISIFNNHIAIILEDIDKTYANKD